LYYLMLINLIDGRKPQQGERRGFLRKAYSISARSVPYRRLAMQEPDQAKGQVLYQLADEADRGVLFTADWKSPRPGLCPPLPSVRPPNHS
jgi:hypothetical protein